MTEEKKLELLERLTKGATIDKIIMDNHGTMTMNTYIGQQQEPSRGGRGERPEELCTEKASALIGALVGAGMLDTDWQPVKLSGSERGLVAKVIGEKLLIAQVWQVFGTLWGEKPETLRHYYNKALDQRKSLEFQDRLKDILR